VADQFTEKAQKVIGIAESIAKKMGHNVIGTEHVLLALLEEGDCIAAQALKSLHVDPDKVRKKIISISGKGEQFTGAVSPSPRMKRVVQIAVEEAGRQGLNYVGTEHLLLGLLIEGEGVAARILQDLKINPEKIWEQVVQLLGGEIDGMPMTGAPAMLGKSSMYGSTPALNEFARDLTAMAQEHKLDPVIGRQNEIERVIQVLSRRTKNNPVLIGEPGVGKTAIVEGLAQRVIDGEVPELLLDKRVLALDLSGIVAGTKYRGEFEERMKRIMEEIRSAHNVIVFIDELHTLIGAGAAEGAIDAANIMKPALARGEIQCVGATTLDEYRRYIEKDAALERRFQPINVGEPSEEEAIAILKGLRDRYEAHHRVQITDEAIERAVTMSIRYISDRFLPDKAIDLMDEAASRVRMKSLTTPSGLKDMEEEAEKLKKEKEDAVKRQDYEKAAQIRDTEQKQRAKIAETRDGWEANREKEALVVGSLDIAEIVSRWTGVPVTRLEETESDRLLKLEGILQQRVIGQEEAVSAVARAIRRARSGLKDPKRPIGSFIFLGPTGVGKTQLAKTLAETMFSSETALVRIDMSEYMEKHSVSRIVGSPPGYIGHDDGGQLTEIIRRKPYSVILFDEIEKAHPDVFNILLQVLEDGRLTDSHGRVVDFRNAVLIMTSNIGAAEMKREALGFAAVRSDKSDYKAMSGTILEEVKRLFKPEFLNRLDELVVFRRLNEEDFAQIAGILFREVNERTSEQGFHLTASPAALSYIVEEGGDREYGARPLRRAIQKMVEDPLSEKILSGEFQNGDSILVDAVQGKLVFSKQSVEESGSNGEG
jgi:ATP-dependent Clp protease ATP-binding subunit ClpC